MQNTFERRAKFILITARTLPSVGRSHHSRDNLSRRGQRKTGTHHENNICLLRITITIQSKRFPNDSFHTVASHSTTDLPVDTDPNSAIAKIIGATNQAKSRPIDSFSLIVDLLVLPTFAEMQIFWKRKIPQKSNGKLPTSTSSACVQNGPPGPSFHAGPEAMGTFAFYIGRLKGALTHFIPLLVAGKTVSLSGKEAPVFHKPHVGPLYGNLLKF